jgi:hypothetical protein
MLDIKIKTLRTVYASHSPDMLTYTNLVKIEPGTIGTLVQSYIGEYPYKDVIYVIKFNVSDEHVYGYINGTSFEMNSLET